LNAIIWPTPAEVRLNNIDYLTCPDH